MDHQELYRLGSDALDKGDFATAYDLLLRSSESFPHFKTYERLGLCLVGLGEHKKAIAYFAAAAGLGSKQKVSYRHLAECFIELGDQDMARRMLERALEIDPMYKTAKNLLASLP